MADRITKEEFIVQAIRKLRDLSKSKGIHSRFSGFNEAFKLQFGQESRATTDKMVAEGKLAIIPAKGGVRLYLPEDAPAGMAGIDALTKILG